jgi:hypothetical protein
MRRNDRSDGSHMSVFTGVPPVATMVASYFNLRYKDAGHT